MNQTKKIDVALFPIPGMVSFPGTSSPLHVFEPRYRSMVRHCLESNTLLAVSHTRKALKPQSTNPSKKPLASSEDLNSNLQSYVAYDVFSAGPCELIETTEDGRMHINVEFNQRLKMIEAIQQVPFQLAHCAVLEDEPSLLEPQQLDEMLADLQQLIAAIAKKSSPELYALLMQDEWQGLDAQAFSYQLFTYFKFEPDFMQNVLELDRVELRLKLIWQGLTQAV